MDDLQAHTKPKQSNWIELEKKPKSWNRDQRSREMERVGGLGRKGVIELDHLLDLIWGIN
ncbi:hypothetical protein C1H46_033708 [Malus baccata]|uniref:Uncharacterized protein n=1 Tax=Malus baccata TaxID=106549 RepID=A0A540L2P7_MALBA|nr:hypothetical protein C1H46_033708 [Malus baccata]